MKTLADIQSIIATTSFPEVDKKELVEFFARQKEESLKVVLKLIQSDYSWCARILENYRAKKNILRNGDAVAWGELVQQEKNELESQA